MCGVAFAVLAFLAVASLETPKKAPDQEIIDWWSKSGNQTTAVVSMFLMVGAGIALAIFSSSLRDRLHAAGSELAGAVHALGAASSVLVLGAAAFRGCIAMAVKVNGEPLPGVDALRLVPELSRNTLEVACCSLAAFALLTALAVFRVAGVPRWLGWASLVLGVLSLALLPFVGPFVLPLEFIWAIAASVALWRTSPVGDTAPRPVARPASA
jgi:hypothetical protein